MSSAECLEVGARSFAGRPPECAAFSPGVGIGGCSSRPLESRFAATQADLGIAQASSRSRTLMTFCTAPWRRRAPPYREARGLRASKMQAVPSSSVGSPPRPSQHWFTDSASILGFATANAGHWPSAGWI